MRKFFKCYSPDEGGASGVSVTNTDEVDSLFEIDGFDAGNNSQIIGGMNAANATDTEGKPLNSEGTVDDEPSEEEFYSLINGRFKKEFQKAVAKEAQAKTDTAFSKRFKENKRTNERLAEAQGQLTTLQPLINAMASKYGINPKDIKAIVEAADKDNSNFEREAYEKGFGDIDAYRQHLKNERELNNYREQERQQQETTRKQQERKKLVDGWLEDAANFKQEFPEFDFKTEWQNDKFKHLLLSGWSVKDAYAAIHTDEYAQKVAKKAENAVIQEVRANKRRPAEGGAGSQTALRLTKSVEDLSREELQRIRTEAKMGKKIKL